MEGVQCNQTPTRWLDDPLPPSSWEWGHISVWMWPLPLAIWILSRHSGWSSKECCRVSSLLNLPGSPCGCQTATWLMSSWSKSPNSWEDSLMDHRWIKTSIHLAMDSSIHSECKLSVLVILQKEVLVYIAWDTEASYYHDKGGNTCFLPRFPGTDSSNWFSKLKHSNQKYFCLGFACIYVFLTP